MRNFIIICFLLLASKSYAQKFVLPDGEYMDTTTNADASCKDYNVYFYQGNGRGKYPESSSSILKETQSFLKRKNNSYKGSGYVTFQFMINCSGKKMNKTRVLQTDEKYNNYHFDKGLVQELYSFLNTMDKWKVFKIKSGEILSYHAFITLKIKNGKVINIIS
ncbi:MAG: hypothetical protein ABI261_09015 [Ginsengibacter sp.]